MLVLESDDVGFLCGFRPIVAVENTNKKIVKSVHLHFVRNRRPNHISVFHVWARTRGAERMWFKILAFFLPPALVSSFFGFFLADRHAPSHTRNTQTHGRGGGGTFSCPRSDPDPPTLTLTARAGAQDRASSCYCQLVGSLAESVDGEWVHPCDLFDPKKEYFLYLSTHAHLAWHLEVDQFSCFLPMWTSRQTCDLPPSHVL